MKITYGGLLAAAVLVAGIAGQSDDASAKKRAKRAATPAAATTSINDCGKMDASKRDSCISMSRPTMGADLYAKWGGKSAAPAVATKVKAAAGAVAAAGAAVAAKAKAALPAGPTNLADCGKVDAGARDACISRSRPVTGAEIYKKK